ncbi:MAG: aspartate 1-decarboxylase [Planctomycetota bacterium]|jgi:aspartate 1-decarboxylase
MLRQVLFAKIHRAVVTACNRDYVGSIVIDPSLLEATGLAVNEKVLVADCETGERFETYIFVGDHGSGAIEVNGAAANLTEVGNHLLIMSFAAMTPQEMSGHRPRVVVCDEHNGIADVLRYDPAPLCVSDPG